MAFVWPWDCACCAYTTGYSYLAAGFGIQDEAATPLGHARYDTLRKGLKLGRWNGFNPDDRFPSSTLEDWALTFSEVDPTDSPGKNDILSSVLYIEGAQIDPETEDDVSCTGLVLLGVSEPDYFTVGSQRVQSSLPGGWLLHYQEPLFPDGARVVQGHKEANLGTGGYSFDYSTGSYTLEDPADYGWPVYFALVHCDQNSAPSTEVQGSLSFLYTSFFTDTVVTSQGTLTQDMIDKLTYAAESPLGLIDLRRVGSATIEGDLHIGVGLFNDTISQDLRYGSSKISAIRGDQYILFDFASESVEVQTSGAENTQILSAQSLFDNQLVDGDLYYPPVGSIEGSGIGKRSPVQEVYDRDGESVGFLRSWNVTMFRNMTPGTQDQFYNPIPPTLDPTPYDQEPFGTTYSLHHRHDSLFYYKDEAKPLRFSSTSRDNVLGFSISNVSVTWPVGLGPEVSGFDYSYVIGGVAANTVSSGIAVSSGSVTTSNGGTPFDQGYGRGLTATDVLVPIEFDVRGSRSLVLLGHADLQVGLENNILGKTGSPLNGALEYESGMTLEDSGYPFGFYYDPFPPYKVAHSPPSGFYTHSNFTNIDWGFDVCVDLTGTPPSKAAREVPGLNTPMIVNGASADFYRVSHVTILGKELITMLPKQVYACPGQDGFLVCGVAKKWTIDEETGPELPSDLSGVDPYVRDFAIGLYKVGAGGLEPVWFRVFHQNLLTTFDIKLSLDWAVLTRTYYTLPPGEPLAYAFHLPTGIIKEIDGTTHKMNGVVMPAGSEDYEPANSVDSDSGSTSRGMYPFGYVYDGEIFSDNNWTLIEYASDGSYQPAVPQAYFGANPQVAWGLLPGRDNLGATPDTLGLDEFAGPSRLDPFYRDDWSNSYVLNNDDTAYQPRPTADPFTVVGFSHVALSGLSERRAVLELPAGYAAGDVAIAIVLSEATTAEVSTFGWELFGAFTGRYKYYKKTLTDDEPPLIFHVSINNVKKNFFVGCLVLRNYDVRQVARVSGKYNPYDPGEHLNYPDTRFLLAGAVLDKPEGTWDVHESFTPLADVYLPGVPSDDADSLQVLVALSSAYPGEYPEGYDAIFNSATSNPGHKTVTPLPPLYQTTPIFDPNAAGPITFV